MPIDHETWTRICRLFDELVVLPPAERRTALAERRDSEDELVRREVERMLLADERGSSGLDRPLAHLPSEQGAGSGEEGRADPPGPVQGDSIGGFVLEEVLGEGGMATVWLARQRDPGRPVALKLQRGVRLSATALARFHYETEVLAQLRHPSIARLYEAGTHWRRVGDAWHEVPFIAMEYVQGGRDLVTWARERGASVAERLELFAQVLGAVAHAHRSGILHRDLKPQNLLVDADGVVKVIDFGIARPTSGRTDAPDLTQEGQLIGTLANMSPEQLRGEGGLDVRSDVYALGCVLFELLEERAPYAVGTGALAETVERVCEGKTVPLERTPRELRWVVQRAMAVDRERRYGSVEELAEDLRRFAADEPLRAGPPGRLYVARKFVRRHRVAVGAAALVLASLAVGFVRSEQAAERTHQASLRTRALHDFLVGMIEDVAGPRATVGEMLDDARRRIEADDEADPLLRAGVQATLAKLYEDFLMHDVARGLLEPAVEVVRELGTPGDITWVQVHLDWMKFLVLDKRYEEVLEVCDLLEPWVANDRGRLFEPQVHANLVARRAAVHYLQGEVAAAEAGFERSLALYEASGITGDPYYWVTLGNLGSCRLARHDHGAAIDCLERRLEEPGVSRRRRADTLEQLATARAQLGQRAEAARLFEEALELYGTAAEARPLRVGVLASLGEQLVELDEPRAEELLVEVLDQAPLVTGPPHYADQARRAERAAHLQLARIAFLQGDPEAAGAAVEDLLGLYATGSLEHDATWFDALLLKARCLEARGRGEDAARVLAEDVDWEAAARLDPLRRERLSAARARLGGSGR